MKQNGESKLNTKAMRIVIDTNVIIAASFKRDQWARTVMRYVHRGACRACISLPMAEELGAKVGELLGKYRVNPEEASGALSALMRFVTECERVDPNVSLSISPDPSDNKFFECAVA